MTIEVVDHDDSRLRKTCENCHAILEYLPMDVEKKTLYCMGEPDGIMHFIQCPECEHTVQVHDPFGDGSDFP